jgi:hypothetical protein
VYICHIFLFANRWYILYIINWLTGVRGLQVEKSFGNINNFKYVVLCIKAWYINFVKGAVLWSAIAYSLVDV